MIITNDKLKVNVSELQYEYFIIGNDNAETLNYKYISKFKNNQIIKNFYYNSKNKLCDITNFLYSDNNKLIKQEVRSASGRKKQEIIYEYDLEKISKIINIIKKNIISSKYDKNGNLIEEIYNIDGKITSITKLKNKYNSKNQLISVEIEINNKIDKIIEYKYNSQDLIAEKKNINKNFIFTINGIQKKSPKILSTIYFYNNNYDIVKTEHYSDGKNNETHTNEYNYDEHGNKIIVKHFRKGEYLRYEYNLALYNISKYKYIYI